MPPRHIWNNYLAAMVASLCMAEFGYDGTMFSSVQVLPSWLKSFNHPDPAEIGAVNTAYSICAVVFGFLVSPVVADRLGRKWALGSGSGLVIVAAILMSLAPNIGAFIGARAISGAGQGLAMPIGTIYIEETVYARTRGRLMSLWQIFYTIGSTISIYVALGTNYYPSLGSWQWRSVTICQLAAPILLIGFLPFCPETPRWYVMHGKVDKARAALARVRSVDEVEPELAEIRAAVAYETELRRNSWRQLFYTPTYRRRLILAMIMNWGQQFTGIGAMSNYSGIILKEVFTETTTVLIVKAVQNIVLLACPLTAFFFIDRLGRRKMFIITAIGCGAACFTIATMVTQTPLVNGRHPLGVGIGYVILELTFHAFYGPGWGAGLWIWTSEIWPTVVRANGVALSSQSQQLANVVLGQAFPELFAAASFYSFYFFMGCNILIAVFCYFFIRETKGVSLEHMDTIFGAPDHVIAGEQSALEAGKPVEADVEQCEDVGGQKRVAHTETQVAV